MTEARRKTRVWAIPPDPPPDVIVLYDRSGRLWVRPLPAKRWYQADPQTRRAYPGKGLTWVDLLTKNGPLTDVPTVRPADPQQGDAR